LRYAVNYNIIKFDTFVYFYSINHKYKPMKKLALVFTLILGTTFFASAQVIPSFGFGIKGGVNLATLSTSGGTFDSGNRAGFNAGVFARIGALGLNLQPELYYASKSATSTSNGVTNTVTFNSIDLPVLLGFKFGALGLGGHLHTGPLVSFLINKDQSFSGALGSVTSVRDYKNQNLAWIFGAGVDIKSVSIDLRYEKGLSTLNSNDGNYQDKLNLWNLSIGFNLL
jgi:hypothetical protein